MAIKFIAVKCPSCGANLPMEEGRTEMYCSCCGAKIIMTNENEHIYRHVDEAAIKQAETEQIVQMKRLEIIEKKRAAKEKRRKFKVILSIILGAIGLLGLAIGGISGNEDSAGYMVGMVSLLILMYMWFGDMVNHDKEDDDTDIYVGEKIRIPKNISDYTEQNYASIEAIFQKAGFTNIRSVALNDLKLGLLKKPGNVESITVNGKAITSGGKKVPSDSTVVISYHSMAVR